MTSTVAAADVEHAELPPTGPGEPVGVARTFFSRARHHQCVR